IVEEPATARVHQHGVARELHQLPGAHLLDGVERPQKLLVAETLAHFRMTIEQHRYVCIARLPRIAEELNAGGFKARNRPVAQPVESFAQRLPPLLRPADSPGVTAAITAPALDAVYAAPGRALVDLRFPGRRRDLQKFTVIRDARELPGFDLIERIGERHLAMAVMMTVGFAIGGN